MAPHLDVRNNDSDSVADRVAQSLEELAVDDRLELIAGQSPTTHLIDYEPAGENVVLALVYEQAGPETWQLDVSKRTQPDGTLPRLDVREIPPHRRHELLLDTFDSLESGTGFVLVNDHDPKPLYHELRSTRGDTIEWTYERRGSPAWTVAIEKTAESEAANDEVLTTFDVRKIPKQERHATIHHRYANVPSGKTVEIIAPHEPQNLHREFRQRYGESFSWDVLSDEPGRCRVHVTKGGRNGAIDGADSMGVDLDIVDELDVRDRPPAQRHEAIFDAYDGLSPGEGFVLVNDHDPKPLYHQFDAEAGDEFHWSYQQREPGEFIVCIGKAKLGTGDRSTSDQTEAPF